MKKKTGLFLGVLIFVFLLFLPAPKGLSVEGWNTMAVAILMAVWWITEAIPIPVTALLPLVLFPILNVGGINNIAAPYANPIIFLFMGGFALAIAMQRWNLHRRIAINILNFVGVKPKLIIFGFIIASAFISMWVSNTATALMMLPIGISVLELLESSKKDSTENFKTVLVLSIAYSCSVGGIGTLIGSPPNALFAGFVSTTYGIDISFFDWMKIGIPIVIIALPLMYYLLVAVYPIRLKEIPGGKKLINDELKDLGKMSNAEKKVAFIFALAALLWIFSPIIENVIPKFSDAGVAIFVVLLLFLIPTKSSDNKHILSWAEAENLPWGILLLFGGGLSLAHTITKTGLAAWIGRGIAGLGTLPIVFLVAISIFAILIVTELMSNTAATATFLPIVASVAIGLEQNPFLFAVPITVAASCAFMLPVSTPPNAVVYGSGEITISKMLKAGIWLDLAFLILLIIAAFTIISYVFEIEIDVLPSWIS